MAQLWCGWQVVMVGHALHHDLRALKLDFLPVIDTSLVTSYRCGIRTALLRSGEQSSTPVWPHTRCPY